MRNVLLVLFLTLRFIAAEGEPVSSHPVIEHIGLRDGISNNFVTDIAQDKHGFLWIGTEAGLNRFDGVNFKIFSERNSRLKGNSINSLFYDETEDKLWIGSKRGVNVLDCEALRLEEPELPDSLGSVNVVDFCRAADGGIYIVNHYNFLLHYKDGKIDVLRQNAFPLLPMSFRSIAYDGHGNLYVGHANYGFSVVNLKTRKVENFIHIPGNGESLPSNDVGEIFIDRYKNIWLGTSRGLALFNPSTKKFRSFLNHNTASWKTPSPNIYSITETNEGDLLIGGDLGGVGVLNISDLSLSNPDRLEFTVLPSSGGRYGISSMNIHKVFQDSYGNIWIGNYSEGLDFISHTHPRFNLLPSFGANANSDKGRPVWSIHTDGNGYVWTGEESKIQVFEDGALKRTYDLSAHLKSSREYISSLVRIGDVILFSSYEDGIFALDINIGGIRRISAPESQNYANCFAVLPDSKVYLGMQDGLYEYANGELKKDITISTAIYNLIPNGITVDRQGKLWIGTYGDGIFIFNKEGVMIHHLDESKGIISNAVKQLYLDSQGCMWVAGQDGLSQIADTDRLNEIRNYGYESGLDDAHIRALQEDGEGNLWFSTNNGISRLNRNTSKIDNYDYNDGLPMSSFMDRAACGTPDGELYFGSRNGVCGFRPELFSDAGGRIPVQIVDCLNINAPKDTSIKVAIGSSGVKEIKIPYNMNSLRITFSVTDYSLRHTVEYSYKVEGIDKNWISAGREHDAILRNLPSGTYTFLIRARQRNHDWDDDNLARLKIVVTPPVWLTWYAKAFYALLITLSVWIIIRIYKRRLMLKGSLEMERRKSIDEQRLNDERLRFYTNITHELRTPLTLIIGPLEDLDADDKLPIPYRKKIKTIHSSALQLLNLINQILEFRKAETHNRRLTVSKGQIASVVAEIGLRYKELNHNERVSINLDIDNTLPEIYFDSDVLHTVLNNLLSNAVKYTPEGSIILSLRSVKISNEDFVEIEVADTGYGIDEKSLPRIFDRYYQAEGIHQASGTGIGLALVRSLSDLHEGTISATSEVGKGTVFTLRLRMFNTYPNALHKESTAKRQASGAEENEIKEISDRQLVVLVVEDNEDIREYIESSLQSKFKVLTAPNGEEGLNIAKSHIPDVIISDIMMPLMDGTELCKSVKDDVRTSHIPVILLTAKDSIQDKETGYEAGADSYITKPFSAKLLASRIQNILDSRKSLAAFISSGLRGGHSGNDPATTGVNYAPHPKISKLDECFIQKFTRIVEDNLTMAELDMTYIQDALGMSHSTLYRKIKGLTGMSGNEFIRKIRLKKGYELLNDGHNVSEAAYSCGFNDVGHFRNCFKNEYGISPSQFIKQNHR